MTPGLRLRSLALRLAGRARALEHVPILGDIGLPLRRRVFLRENRGDGALRLAGAAIDAFVRVDIQLILALVDAVHGADVHARPILHIDAGLCDDVRHSSSRYCASLGPPNSGRIANIGWVPPPFKARCQAPRSGSSAPRRPLATHTALTRCDPARLPRERSRRSPLQRCRAAPAVPQRSPATLPR